MRRPRRQPTRRSRPTFNWLGVLLIGTSVAAIAGLIVWAGITTKTGARIDKVSLCDTRGPTAVTTILIDATDPLPPVQRLAVANRVTTLVQGLSANERVAVYEIRPDQNLLAPEFEKCRPAAPSEVNTLTGNKRLAKQRFEDEFGATLKRVLDASLDQAPSRRSPIMEAIQAASVKSFSAPDLRSAAPGFRRQLIIISDMMQFSDAGDHYRGVPDFDTFKASPAFAKYASDLRDVSVTILYLRKDDAAQVQGRSHIDFWSQWFSAQKASVDHVVAL